MAWLDICFGLSNTCDDVWSNEVGQNSITYEKHDEDCVKEVFQLAMVKFDRDGEEGREALRVGNCSIHIWDGSEMELAWCKKNGSYLENNFQIFLLSGISNTLICKVRDVLCWLNFLSTKTSKIVWSTFCWANSYLNMIYIHFSFIYIKSFFIIVNIKWYTCWYCWCWGFLSVFSWSWIQFTLIRSYHSCCRHWSRIIVLCTAAAVLKYVETLSIQMTIAFQKLFKCYCWKQND